MLLPRAPGGQGDVGSWHQHEVIWIAVAGGCDSQRAEPVQLYDGRRCQAVVRRSPGFIAAVAEADRSPCPDRLVTWLVVPAPLMIWSRYIE